MSDETVVVQVTLPKLPDGYEYTGEYRNIQVGEWTIYLERGVVHVLEAAFKAARPVVVVRRIAPPEHTVMVELRESLAKVLNAGLEMTVQEASEVRDAARKALAQQEVCGALGYGITEPRKLWRQSVEQDIDPSSTPASPFPTP